MAKINLNNIENVEGKYHVMFYEGKIMVDYAKTEIKYAFLSLLFFLAVILLLIIISGFNLFYLGFVAVFLLVFLTTVILLKRQQRVGKRQCVFAVQNSHTSDIVNKQVDVRKSSKLLSKSVCGKVEDETHLQKKFRKQKQKQLASKIRQFEKQEK